MTSKSLGLGIVFGNERQEESTMVILIYKAQSENGPKER